MMQHRAAPQLQRPRDVFPGGDARDRQQLRLHRIGQLGKMPGTDQLALAPLGLAGRNEGAAALAAVQPAVAGQIVQRLAGGALADGELGGQFPLGRQHRIGLPFAGRDPLDDPLADLLVERLESGLVGRHW